MFLASNKQRGKGKISGHMTEGAWKVGALLIIGFTGAGGLAVSAAGFAGEEDHPLFRICVTGAIALYLACLIIAIGQVLRRLIPGLALDSLTADEKRCLAAIEAELRCGTLFTYFQPIYDLRLHKIVAAEAVPFWRHRRDLAGRSGEIVRLLQRASLLHHVTRAVLANAARLIAELEASGTIIDVSINISEAEIDQLDLIEEIDQVCQKAAISPHRLQIEISEIQAARWGHAGGQMVRQLAQRSIKFILDDFGAIFGSLTAVEQLSFALIKIHPSQISRLISDSRALAIVKASRGLATGLGIDVIAEGVEDRLTAARLAEMGIHLVQGPFVGEAMPREHFVSLAGAATGINRFSVPGRDMRREPALPAAGSDWFLSPRPVAAE